VVGVAVGTAVVAVLVEVGTSVCVVDEAMVDDIVVDGSVPVVEIVVLYRHLYSGTTQTKSFALLHKSTRGSHSACKFNIVVVVVDVDDVDVVVVTVVDVTVVVVLVVVDSVVVRVVVVVVVVGVVVVVVSVAVVVVGLYRHLYSGSTQTKSFALLHKSARGSHSACKFKSVVVVVVVVVVDLVVVDFVFDFVVVDLVVVVSVVKVTVV